MQNREDNRILSRKMIMTGMGQVSYVPDLAKLRIGVQTVSDSVTIAQEENATTSKKVIDSLKDMGITEFQTVQYQVEQIIEYQNGERIDRGYQVRNLLQIILQDMDIVGAAIDTAVNNGANIVDSITFDIDNPDYYYQQALNIAVKNALNKAKSVASSLGARFLPTPVLITENPPVSVPYARNFATREIALATPIEPGTNQIEASVTVEFIY